jgi:sigma-B regulation protein RsbU (phosphoserine phosphatase)
MTIHLSGLIGDRFASWPLENATLRLGRSSKNTVQITDATVSKEHAEIYWQNGQPMIKDLGSRNGTRVNGVSAAHGLPLRLGDKVEIGHVPFSVTDSDAGPPTRLSESASLSSSLNIPVNKILEAVEAPGREKTSLVRLLAEAGQLLVLPRSLKETGDEILEIVEKAVSSTRSILLLKMDAASEPVQVAARYRGGNSREPLVLSRTIMNLVLEDCRAVLTTDAAQDPRFLGQHSIVSQAVHSAIAVPLFDNTRVLGLIYVDSHDVRTEYGQDELEILTLLANMAAVKITNVRLLEAEAARARMIQELATARGIQRGLLPAEPPPIDGYEIEAFLETCYEVGGDLYDFHVSPEGALYFLLGDVSGKGMGAAMLMSSFMASARVLFENGSEPEEIMNRLNAIIHRSTDSGHFVTAFLGKLDLASGNLRYVNAGHNPPYLLTEGVVSELEATGVPAGMLPGIKYPGKTVMVPPGSLLALYTDGIPEARCDGDFFGEDRLISILRSCAAGTAPRDLCQDLLGKVSEFLSGGPREDDLTLVLLRRR